MLAIINALKDWRHFLEGLPKPFEIWSDHENLKYWREPQDLSRRQARWAQYLSRFNFVLTHIAGVKNIKADVLSRRPDYQVWDFEDNKDQIVLRPEHFVKIATSYVLNDELERRTREAVVQEAEVLQGLEKLRKSRLHRLTDGTLEWEESDGLIYYKEKLYIPNAPGLRHDIVKQCHDAITVGHPGRWGTIEAVTQFYWWPRMKEFITKYTDGCDLCQRMKAATHPKATLQPNEVPEGPWQTIGIDFIVKLPKSNGYDSIAVYVDHFTKQTHVLPINKSINAEGVADLHVKEIFRLHGIPRKIFSTGALYLRHG